MGVGLRRHGCRVGRGALIVGAGGKLAESKGEEEATGTVPDGAQVSAEDAEERVHPVTYSCWVRVAMRVQRWPDSARVVVPVEVKRTISASPEIRLKIRLRSILSCWPFAPRAQRSTVASCVDQPSRLRFTVRQKMFFSL